MGEGKLESYCLVGLEFQFYKMERVVMDAWMAAQQYKCI